MDRFSWRKSSHSSDQGGNCVEVAHLTDDGTAVRDSKNPTGPALSFGPTQWAAFMDSLSRGEIG